MTRPSIFCLSERSSERSIPAPPSSADAIMSESQKENLYRFCSSIAANTVAVLFVTISHIASRFKISSATAASSGEAIFSVTVTKNSYRV